MIQRQKKKAMERTLLVAIILSLPLGYLMYLHSKRPDINPGINEYTLKPFFFMTDAGQGISFNDFRNKISLLAIVPEFTTHSKASMIEDQLAKIEKWAVDELKIQEDLQQSVNLFLLSTPELKVSEKWNHLIVNPESDFNIEVQPFLRTHEFIEDFKIILVDSNLSVKAEYSPKSPYSWEDVKKVWSKMIFNHFLDHYLSKRTFFGPKKEHARVTG